jgi:hypothetical protein
MKNFLRYATRLNTSFWERVFNATSLPLESLCCFRILSGIFLLFFFTPNLLWLSEVPTVFFKPPLFSIANLADDFPDMRFMLVVNALLILCSFTITAGIKTRLSTAVYLVSFIFLSSFQFSFGKIDHTAMLLLVMLFCLAFSDWGCLLAIVPDQPLKRNFNTRSLSLLSVLICFGFFSAGFDKALHWINLDFNTSGSAAWYYKQERAYLLGPFVPGLVPFWGFKVLDYVAVAFELSPILFLLTGPRAWRMWLIFACLFHLSNTVFFNLDFTPFAIAYLAFADYSSLYNWLKRNAKRTIIVSGSFILVLVFLYRIHLLLTNVQSLNLFVLDIDVKGSLYFSIVIWVLSISLLILNVRQIAGNKAMVLPGFTSPP